MPSSGRHPGRAEKTGAAQVGRGWRGVIRGDAHLALQDHLLGAFPGAPPAAALLECRAAGMAATSPFSSPGV